MKLSIYTNIILLFLLPTMGYTVDWNILGKKVFFLKSTVELGDSYSAVGELEVNFRLNDNNKIHTKVEVKNLRIETPNVYLPKPTIDLTFRELTDTHGEYKNMVIQTTSPISFRWENILLKLNKYDTGSLVTLDFTFTFRGPVNEKNSIEEASLPYLSIKITPQDSDNLIYFFIDTLNARQDKKSIVIEKKGVPTKVLLEREIE